MTDEANEMSAASRGSVANYSVFPDGSNDPHKGVTAGVDGARETFLGMPIEIVESKQSSPWLEDEDAADADESNHDSDTFENDYFEANDI